MNSSQKFVLPSPNFNKKAQTPPTARPHFLTPSGMTLHARHQPPPMYGKRGATYPGKYLKDKRNNFVTPPAAIETEDTNESQYCEACDMELQSMDDLRRHRAQHEKCPVSNCNYRGHPAVMDKHVTDLHSSGLFEKFKKLSTPEEIAAWREERKKRYPTVENTLMRQRAKEQREKRGERLEGNKSRFGKYEDRKRAQDNTKRAPRPQSDKPNQNARHQQKNNMHNKQPKNKRRRKEEQQKLEEKKQNEKIAQIKTVKQESDTEAVAQHQEEVERSCDGVYMFKGTTTLCGYEHLKPKKVKEANVLTSLLGMYGSDAESEEDGSENEGKECEDNDYTIDCEGLNTHKGNLNSEQHSECLTNKQIGKIPPSEQQVNDEKAKELEPEAESEREMPIKEKSPLEVPTNIADIGTNSIEKLPEKTNRKAPSQDISYNKTNSERELANIEEFPQEVATNIANVQEDSNENEEVLEEPQAEMLNEDVSENQSDPPENKEVVDSDNEAPEEAPIARTSDIPMPTKRTPTIKENEASTSAGASATKRAKAEQLARCKRQKSGLDYRKARLRKQNTLLEKLLEPDIRHERNVLLQCVRYVCQNNFFGIGEQKKE